MERVNLDSSLVPSTLTNTEQELATTRIAENIIPGVKSDEQPIILLNYISTATLHPRVETHRALYSESMFNPKQTKEAIRKREFRRRGDNYSKQKDRRRKHRKLQPGLESPE